MNKVTGFLFVLLFSTVFCLAQESATTVSNFSFVSFQYDLGRTSPANTYFPETKPFQGIEVAFGRTNNRNDLEWARQLNFPRTGISVSYSDFGNKEKIGSAVSVIPFIDFPVFRKWSNRFDANIGIGASYFDVIYDLESNVTNQAISTHITWAFRSNLRYDFLRFKNGKSQIVLGYYHNSNGHVRLPNYGLNTFLLGLNTEFNFNKNEVASLNLDGSKVNENSSLQTYYCYRFGLGQNVLTKYDDHKREVYTVSASLGRIKNKTFKYGLGMYYRFYESYYNHIQKEGELINDMYPDLKKNPILKASSFGVFADGEVLLSHVGLEMQIGLNFYKPFYKVDWKLNQGEIIYDGSYQLGELNWYYNVKHLISSRLGLKYYAFDNNKSPTHNLFIGAFINANLGQADFSEVGLGYVFCPSSKKK
jgi:hypothetical protein